MKKLLFLLLLVVSLPAAFSQVSFERIFRGFGGTDESWGHCVHQAPDGGYVILADTWTGDVHGFMMIRTNASGDTVLTRSFGDMATTFAPTPDGGYIVTGLKESQLMMLKTDAEFNMEWVRTAGLQTSLGVSVATTEDGGYLFAGNHTIHVNMSKRLFLVRTDSAGDTLWTRYFGAQDMDFNCASLIPAPGGNFMVSGSLKQSPGGPSVIFLMKVDAGGDSLWMKRYRKFENTYGTSAIPTPGGGYLLAGTTHSYTEAERIWLVYTDAGGDTLRTRSIDGSYRGGSVIAASLSQGGAMLAAARQPDSLTATQAWLLRLSEAGDTLWSKLVGTTDHELPFSIRQTTDNGFIITGWSVMHPDRNTAIYLVKTDSSGNYFPVGIKPCFAPGPVTIAPNPAREFVDIGCTGSVGSVRVYNGRGEPVLTLSHPEMGPSGCRVSLAGLPCGLYFLEIHTDQTVLYRKVIRRD